jgi:hypothetical protein
MEIWTSAADGSGAVRLTSIGGALAGLPRWSARRPRDLFRRTNGLGLFKHLCGIREWGSPRPVTDAAAEDNKSSWSHNGRWIYFSSNRTGRWQVWKVSVDGGAPVQLTRQGGNNPFESADQKFVYYAKERISPAIWRVPVDGGEEQPVLDQPRPKTWSYWALGAAGIFFLTQLDDSVFEGRTLSSICSLISRPGLQRKLPRFEAISSSALRDLPFHPMTDLFSILKSTNLLATLFC